MRSSRYPFERTPRKTKSFTMSQFVNNKDPFRYNTGVNWVWVWQASALTLRQQLNCYISEVNSKHLTKTTVTSHI